MCRDGDNIQRVKCSFVDTGRYHLFNLNEVITSVEIDRLEHVMQLIMKSSTYDSFAPCEHAKFVSEVVETVEDAGTTTHCVSTFYIKQLYLKDHSPLEAREPLDPDHARLFVNYTCSMQMFEEN